MINRRMVPVSIVTFSSTKDSKGQPRRTIESTRTVEMMIKIYNQKNVSSPLYTNVEMIGITKDFNITTDNQIQYSGVSYNVLYTIPSGKYLQVLMQKVM